jgi:hypothetical protein
MHVYMPTSEYERDEVENLYGTFEYILEEVWHKHHRNGGQE